MPKHLALPIRVSSAGTLDMLEQDGPAEVAQSVALLVSTRPGERRSNPDYGMPDPLFSVVDVDDLVADAIDEWEPRAADAVIEHAITGLYERSVAVHLPDQPAAVTAPAETTEEA